MAGPDVPVSMAARERGETLASEVSRDPQVFPALEEMPEPRVCQAVEA